MIAAVLICLAVAAAPPASLIARIEPDSIWKEGHAEVVTYSTMRPGIGKSYESRIDIRKVVTWEGDEQSGFHEGRFLLMTLWSDTTIDKSVRGELRVGFGSVTVEPMTELARGSRTAAGAQNRGEQILYDGLPVWLRGFDLTKPARFQVSMLPSLLSEGSSQAKPFDVTIEIVGPAGPPSETSHGGLEVDVRYEGKVDKLWFHPGPGHVLLAWDKADGTTLRLKSQRRE